MQGNINAITSRLDIIIRISARVTRSPNKLISALSTPKHLKAAYIRSLPSKIKHTQTLCVKPDTTKAGISNISSIRTQLGEVYANQY